MTRSTEASGSTAWAVRLRWSTCRPTRRNSIRFQSLLKIHQAVVGECPDWWGGVNCLDLPPREVFQHLAAEVAGVWVDHAEIDEQGAQQGRAEAIQAARSERGWQGLYFGGVAFKYQRPVEELEQAARLAARYMDVVTTGNWTRCACRR